jgi:hypothetical protein
MAASDAGIKAIAATVGDRLLVIPAPESVDMSWVAVELAEYV